jgi:cobalt-zinc-cadmium efflux system outer membrane protein
MFGFGGFFTLKRIIMGLLIGLALFESPPTLAESAMLTVDQAIETAIKNNPQIQATQARLGVSEAEVITAGTRLNPSVLSDNGVAEKTYRLGVEQTIELGGKRKHRVAVAQAQRDTVKAEINTALMDLRSEVRRAYTALFNLQERQATLENILQVAQELVTIAQKREKAGDISTLDVLQTDILRVNAQNDLQTLSVELVHAKNRLNALLNQPLTSTVTLAPPNTAPQITPSAKTLPATPGTLQGRVSETDMNLDDLIAQALAQRPEIQQNLRNIEASRLQASLAKANRIPNLSLAAGPDYVAEPGQKEVGVFIVGTFEIPLFNRQQGPIQEAIARQSQFKKEQAALKNRVTLEVNNAYNAFKANRERIKRYETALLPMSVAVTDKSRQAFQEGKTSILTPIQAQQAYMNARLGYLQALLDFQNAISDLERAVGTGL